MNYNDRQPAFTIDIKFCVLNYDLYVSSYFIFSQTIEDMEGKKKYANKKKNVSSYRKIKGRKKRR